ncbi:nitroreductase family protein [Candidatus Nitrosocosmicus sp. T]
MEDNRILESMFPSDILPKVYPKEPSPQENSAVDDVLSSNIFNVMLNRRSQRKFEEKEIESWKIDIIFAAADTAPNAGGFQGFEIYHIKNPQVKQNLVKAANNQPYVNAPLVLVFCSNPSRIKLNFHPEILHKFSIQDAALAAGYAQLAAHALGLSSVWIGMFNEHMLREVIGTEFEPTSVLCMGYPKKMLIPKPKRNLTDLIHTV